MYPCGSEQLRDEFPVLSKEIFGRPIVHFDTAVGMPIHRASVTAWSEYCSQIAAPPEVSVHELGAQASDAFRAARQTIARFIGARESEILFTRNATEAIRTVSTALQLPRKSEVVVLEGEHYSNLLCWVGARQPKPVVLKNTEDGGIDIDHLDAVVSANTKLAAVSLVNHVTGRATPLAALRQRLADRGAMLLLDATQAIGRIPIDVNELGCDFLAFSSSFAYAPPGVGVLWARRPILEEMVFRLGGGSVRRVDAGGKFVIPADLPHRAESGTSNAPGAVALAASLEVLSGIGMDAVAEHERAIAARLLPVLRDIPGVRVLGGDGGGEGTSIVSFTIEEDYRMMTCQQLSAALSDSYGILCSGGPLDGSPMLARLGCADGLRLSGGIHTTLEEADRALRALREALGHG